MRFLIILALLFLCYYAVKKALLPLLRSYKSFKGHHNFQADKELVQDPWCHTYIPKETALRATISGEVFYFCSRECLDAYKEARDRESGK
jgi:YHS domain-containing protein